jgi:hypothetical protein
MKPSLQLLDGGEAAPEAPRQAVQPTLEAAPFRPGEMPTTLLLELTEEAKTALGQRVSRRSLPVELWVRCSVEAERHVRAVTERHAVERDALERALCAEARGPDQMRSVYDGRHAAYADMLLTSHHGSSGAPEFEDAELAVRVSYDLAVAWTSEAARCGQTPGQWVSALIVESPACSPEWEAASAMRGRSFGEWVYLCALDLLTER